jgi:cell division protein FtsZ
VGIETLRAEVDTLIIVPNERLLEMSNKSISVVEAFNTADDVLRAGVQGITDLITTPGLINLDFADVKSVMQGAGSALMGIGTAKGEDRAIRAAEIAVSSPLLEASIDGAHGVLLLIQGASDLGLHEINDAARLVQEAVSPEANIIFGATVDDTLGDEVRITVIAAGFDGGYPGPRKTPVRSSFASSANTGSLAASGMGIPATNAASTPLEVASEAKSSWFDEVSSETSISEVEIDVFTTPISTIEAAVAGYTEPQIPQTSDGTFGDDLDIPEFLRDK